MANKIVVTRTKKLYRIRLDVSSFHCSRFHEIFFYIPDEDVLFIFCAPNFIAAGLAPLPRPDDKGLALVVGGGAAMAAQGSSSSAAAPAVFMLRGFDAVFGAGAAIDPHRSSSSSLLTFAGIFGRLGTAYIENLPLDRQ